jgi:mRNA-degrading endonuclease toxin of MazEF toxin-antitoxin module
MSILKDALRKAGFAKLKIVEGGIYRLKDSLIQFPDSDASDNRTKHDFRTVLVLSNQKLIDHYACPCVVVAPMSHLTHYSSLADHIIRMTATNHLSSDSRVLLSYIQPVLKSDLEKYIGTLSDDEWQEVMEQMIRCFDH